MNNKVNITVHFDAHYQKYTNCLPEVQIVASTCREVVHKVFSKFPQLLVFLLEKEHQEGKNLVLIKNDLEFLELTDFDTVLTESCQIQFNPLLPSGEYGLDALISIGSALVDIMYDVGMISLETWTAIGPAIEAAIGAVVMLAASIAVGAILGALSDDIAAPAVNTGNLGNSATYTFNGIKNTTASGTSLQVVYGRVRTGGHIISMFTDTDTIPYTYKVVPCTYDSTILNYQIALCEGEIETVSDVYINKLPVYYYSAVYTYPNTPDYLRLGTAVQAIMPEFSVIPNTTSISRKAVTANGLIEPEVIPSTKKYIPVYGYFNMVLGELSAYPMYGYYKLVWNDDPNTNQ